MTLFLSGLAIGIVIGAAGMAAFALWVLGGLANALRPF